MISTSVAAITAVITLAISVMISAFVSGVLLGSMRSDIKTMKHDIAEIKGVFVLKPKE